MNTGGKVNFCEPGLSLDSTTPQWLAVTNDDEIAAKATASLNSVDGYGFVAPCLSPGEPAAGG